MAVKRHSENSAGSAHASSAPRRIPHVLWLIFVVLAAGIVATGCFYYRGYERHYRAQVERKLLAIADLKVNELTDWREGHLANAALLFKNAAFSSLVQRSFESAQDHEARPLLRTWMGLLQSHLQYDRISLLDANGVMRMSVPDTPDPVAPHLALDAAEALRSGKVTFLDFHRDAPDGPIHLAVLVPVVDDADSIRPIGVLVLRIDPVPYLYPFISRWPTPSETAETLLVRRDGEDALFLDELRFRKNTALLFREPLTRKELPAVRAVLGQEGIVEGSDYRGVPVVAAVRSVPDSPWFLVARMDISEVYGPLRERLWLAVVLAGVLLLSAGMGVGLVWRQQSARFYREKVENADVLRASEVQYRQLFETAKEGILILDAQTGMVVDVNPSMIELLCFPREYFLSKTVWELGFLKDVIANQANFAELRQKGHVRHDDLPLEAADGRRIDVEFVSNVCEANHHGVIQCNIRDITERKRAEEALRKSNERFQLAINAIGDGLWEWDIQTNQEFFAPRWCEIIGYSVDDPDFPHAFKSWASRIHPDDRARVMGALNKHLENGAPYDVDYRHRHKSGEYRWQNSKGQAIRDESGKPLKMVGCISDITERKRAEESLRGVQERLASAISATQVGMFDWDLAKGKILWTETHEAILGYAPATTITSATTTEHDYRRWTDRVHPDDLARVEGQMRICARERRPFQEQYRIIWPDKSEHWIETKGVFFHAGDGEAVRMVGLVIDITDRKQAEEALRESEERFRTLVEAVTDYTYWVTVQDGRVVETTHGPGCLGVTGYSPEEFHADRELWLQMAHPEDQPAVLDWAAKLSSGQKVGPLEHRIIHKNGQTRWVRSSAVPRHDSRGQYIGYEGLIQDITGYRRLQDQFAQAQKMEAIGQLAGGVAHDFRNQLTVIKGFGEMLLRRELVKEAGKEPLEHILKAADRSATIAGQLLAFSRQQTLRPEVININSVTGDMMKSLAQTLGEDIRPSIMPCADLWNTRVDTGQFQQALLNLVLNARDAMPQGGKLTIETENIVLDENSVRRHVDVSAGRYVVLTVSDTGAGIAPEVLDHIFDPFFTTKPVGEGTGLGLAMVHGFAAQSGGFVEVQSQPGQRTTFRLCFPAVDDVAGCLSPLTSA